MSAILRKTFCTGVMCRRLAIVPFTFGLFSCYSLFTLFVLLPFRFFLSVANTSVLFHLRYVQHVSTAKYLKGHSSATIKNTTIGPTNPVVVMMKMDVPNGNEHERTLEGGRGSGKLNKKTREETVRV